MGFSVSSIADTVDQANKIFNILKIILAFFGVAALIVAIVGMINTMTIALLERTNEIGVMKIFGIRERMCKNFYAGSDSDRFFGRGKRVGDGVFVFRFLI